MLKAFTLNCLLTIVFSGAMCQSATEELDVLVDATKLNELPFNLEEVTVRGFDGENPPPRMNTPTRPLFYGYGATAYTLTSDSLLFFNIVQMEAVHRGADGSIKRKFTESGNHHSPEFKNYFLRDITEEERKNIYLENIYLQDKKGNYFKITEPQPFCPHCAW